MHHPELYSIQEARKLLGGISRNTIYQLLRSGELASVVIGCRRFISAADHGAHHPVDDQRQPRTSLNPIVQEAPRCSPPSLTTDPSQSRAAGTQLRP